MTQDEQGKAAAGRSPRAVAAAGVGAAVLVVALIAGVLFAFPVLQVKSFAVTGAQQTSAEAVEQATGIKRGDNLVRISATHAAAGVAALPWVEKAQVSRQWPGTVAVEVSEREAVLAAMVQGQTHLVDAHGVAFISQDPPEGAVALRGVSGDDHAVYAAAVAGVQALRAVTPQLAGRLTAVEAASATSMTFIFDSDRQVYWGSSDRAEDKARASEVALGREGNSFNVSNPVMITSR